MNSQFESHGECPAESSQYSAALDVLGIRQDSNRFEIFGSVTNIGSVSWHSCDDEWSVSLGARVFSDGMQLLDEYRYPMPADEIQPGETFPFQISVDVSYVVCAALECGLVVENKFWFSSTQLRPLTLVKQGMDALVLSPATEIIESRQVSLVAFVRQGVGFFAEQWLRDGLFYELGSSHSNVHIVPSEQAEGSALEESNSLVAACNEQDIVMVSRGVQFSDASWLDRLRRAAYIDPLVAAAGAPLVDSSGRVLDIGGDLYSTGYTRSPGFLRSATDKRVLTYHEPGFLPFGAVYLRRDALELVGGLSEELHDPQVAMIEWGYRARAYGRKVRIEHSAKAVVSAEEVAVVMRPPIPGRKLRSQLLQSLSNMLPEGRYV